MSKVRMKQIGNARGFYEVISPYGHFKVAGKEQAISMVKATRRLMKKKAIKMRK